MNLEKHIEGALSTVIPGKAFISGMAADLRWDHARREENAGNLRKAENLSASAERDVTLRAQLQDISFSIQNVLSGAQDMRCVPPLMSDGYLADNIDNVMTRTVELYIEQHPEAVDDLYDEAVLVENDLTKKNASEVKDRRVYLVTWYLIGKIDEGGVRERLAKLLRLEPGQIPTTVPLPASTRIKNRE